MPVTTSKISIGRQPLFLVNLSSIISRYSKSLRTKMVVESTRIYHEIVFYAPITQCSFKRSRRDLGFDQSEVKSVS